MSPLDLYHTGGEGLELLVLLLGGFACRGGVGHVLGLRHLPLVRSESGRSRRKRGHFLGTGRDVRIIARGHRAENSVLEKEKNQFFL